MSRRIYYSVRPKNSGLTDQLLQFSALYELGQSLGYTYWHEPFLSPRSSSIELLSRNEQRLFKLQQKWPFLRRIFKIEMPFNIYDFLGIDDYFLGQIDRRAVRGIKKKALIFNYQLAEGAGIEDLAGLQAYVRQFAADHGGSQEAILIQFVLQGGWPVWQIIRQQTGGDAAQLDLRGIYFQKRQQQPWPSVFEEGKVKVVLHMRLGDTAVLPTPWNTFIPLWPFSRRYHEYDRVEDVPNSHRIILPDDYFSFMLGLASSIDAAQTTMMFSDGYKRSQHLLQGGMKRNQLHLTSEKFAALVRSMQSFDETQFRQFDQIEGSRLFIGEKPEYLCHLIHSFLTADLVIIGAQLWMFPKFSALYFDQDTMPLLIILHKAEDEDQLWRYGGLNLGKKRDKFIFVNLYQPDYAEIASRLERHLAQDKSS